jgi:hypothetical protein
MNRGQDFPARMGLLFLGRRQGLPDRGPGIPGRSIHCWSICCFDPTGVEIPAAPRMRVWSMASLSLVQQAVVALLGAYGPVQAAVALGQGVARCPG